MSVIRPYIPVSWFHARGIFKVLRRLTPRLPDVGGKLFLTFTVNPALYESPAVAYDHARDRLRRIFHRLRGGVSWEGKTYIIDSPYAVKVEFHRNGWAHFHVIFLTRRYVPGALLNHLWGIGRTNVRRISDHQFRYLLKYVTKGGGLPDWVREKFRLRVFQASKGFYTVSSPPLAKDETSNEQATRRRQKTIGERLERWGRTALFQTEERFQLIILPRPFFELMNELVYSYAVSGRYLGGGHFQINDTTELIPWLT